jgi:6-phosphogluconolactonase/glucosamine-6-phosphate isomerase/deaminase
VEEILFVVAGSDKTAALERLLARDSKLTAWRAVERCPKVHIWTDAAAWPP